VTVTRRSPRPSTAIDVQRRVSVEVVLANPSGGRSGPRIARWFLERSAAHPGVRARLLDLGRGSGGPDLGRRIAAADGVVLVTPEYNHSFPGELKTAIDSLRTEWRLTPVGVVSHGGISGGLRATEQLRLVLAELRAVVVRETVSFAHPHERFGDDGRLLDPAGADAAASRMLTELAWWGRALRQAQRREPFPL
jgi:hypothetical protein